MSRISGPNGSCLSGSAACLIAVAVQGCLSAPPEVEARGSEREQYSDARAQLEVVDQALSNPKKVEICHKGSTISVDQSAVTAHLKHGDDARPCATPCSPNECDDSNACTADLCLDDGSCGHRPVSCDDGNVCTSDACDPIAGCLYRADDGAACSDGNECTGTDTCRAGQCAGSAIVGCCTTSASCSDGNVCTTDSCVNRACTNAPVSCSVSDRCLAAFCDPVQGGCATSPVNCDDNNPCTVDSCDSASGCHSIPAADGQSCEDASCTGASCAARSCFQGACVSAAVNVSCDQPSLGGSLQAAPGTSVAFRGTVLDTRGVSDVQVNGSSTPLAADGTFSANVPVRFGVNVVEVVATGRGTRTRTLCSFSASDRWLAPGAALSDESALRLTGGAIDDGLRDASFDSFADILSSANASSAVRTALDGALRAANPLKPAACDSQTCTFLGCVCWFRTGVDYRALTVPAPTTSASLVDGGIAVVTSFEHLRVQLHAWGEVTDAPFDSSGWVEFASLQTRATYDVALTAGRPRAMLRVGSASTVVGTISVDFPGVDGWVINNIIVPLVQGSLRNLVVSSVQSTVVNTDGAVLDQLLTSLDVSSVGSTYNVPRLNGLSPIPLSFSTSFSSASATATGMLFGAGYRWSGPAVHANAPLGIAVPADTSTGVASNDEIAQATSVAVFDQILYALWRAGYFDVAVTTSSGSVTFGASLAPSATMNSSGGVDLAVAGLSAVVTIPGVLDAVTVQAGADLSAQPALIGRNVRLANVQLTALHVSTPNANLSASQEATLEAALSEAIVTAVGQATSVGLPAWPELTFATSASLAAYGVPTGRLGVMAPSLSTQPPAFALGGAFGLR